MPDLPISELADINPALGKVPSDRTAVTFLSMADVSESGRLLSQRERPFGEVKMGFTRFQEGDVLFAKITPCMENGKGALAVGLKAGVGCGSTEFHVLRARGDNDPRYLYHWLQWGATRQKAQLFMSGSAGQQRVPVEFFRRFRIPAPGPEVQQRIAAILTSLDSAIEATEALIEKHQKIKAGLMHELFTRGVGDDGAPRRENGDGLTQTPLGPMPSAWRPSTVGRSFDIDSGITLGPHRRPAKGAAPYLRVANVYREELRLDDIAHLEALAGDESCALRVGDLLVVEGHANPSEIGRCAMVTESATGMLFQNHLFRLRAHAVSAAFGLLWLNSFHMQRYWERTCSTSSGLNTINRRMLNSAPIYLPSSEEQARIVAVAGASRYRLEAERASLAKLRMQKQGLMQDLLTGKVRVPLREAEPTAA